MLHDNQSLYPLQQGFTITITNQQEYYNVSHIFRRSQNIWNISTSEQWVTQIFRNIFSTDDDQNHEILNNVLS